MCGLTFNLTRNRKPKRSGARNERNEAQAVEGRVLRLVVLLVGRFQSVILRSLSVCSLGPDKFTETFSLGTALEYVGKPTITNKKSSITLAAFMFIHE